MALINRVARLFKADFNAVLDQIEEPEQLLKQAIRDMEDELAANEQAINLCVHDQDALRIRCTELQSSLDEINEQLDLCFETENEALAKPLVRKKLEAERIQKKLATKSAANERFLSEQGRLLEENRSTLDSLKQKAELVSHTRSVQGGSSDYDDIAWMSREFRIADDEVEIALLREKASRGAA